MNFSHALVALIGQSRLTRVAWVEKFVVFQKGYPDGIAINQNTADATGYEVGSKHSFTPYFMMSENGVFSPWLPTAVDLLAEDWYIL